MPLKFGTLHWVAKPVTRSQGLRILERDQFRCRYCGLDGRASFENALVMGVDFLVARARKGKNDADNLVACCRPCNVIKGRGLFGSFEEAKAYVLARREELRKAWASHTEPNPKLPTARAAKTDEFEITSSEILDDDEFFPPELGGEQ
jgi:HNH endonuclease